MERDEPTKAGLLGTYAALMGLLGLSAWAAYWPVGATWNLIIALAIAAVKTTLIFLIFMQLKYQQGLVRLFALAGLIWLVLAGLLTFTDYFTRNLLF